jgi:hypothetical protein
MPQMRALLRLAARHKISWDRILPEGRKLDQLTRQEASRLIDWLQRMPESHAMSRSHARDDEPALVGADPSDATWSGQHGGNGQQGRLRCSRFLFVKHKHILSSKQTLSLAPLARPEKESPAVWAFAPAGFF